MSDFWVFGYGSLIWNPGFEFKQESKAKIFGYHRALCVHSWHYRGTKEKSGLVLGLDYGGSCAGLARQVDYSVRDKVIEYLRARELVSNVYREVWVKTQLEGGEWVDALTYVVARDNIQYAPKIPLDKTSQIVKRAAGIAGENREYVENTNMSLSQMGILDRNLQTICDLMKKS